MEQSGKGMAPWTGTSRGRGPAPPRLEHLVQVEGT